MALRYDLYHNPRCRKSREALELLREHDIEPNIILYLQNPPTKAKLKKLAKLLGKKPIEFTRAKEKIFKELGLSRNSSDTEILDAMTNHPILIERPILVKDSKEAILGRPPEDVLKLL